MGEIVMSTKEQKIYEQAIQVICKRLTIVEFAQLNNKSYRQSQRIIKKVKDLGMKGVKHGGIGKVPYNKTPIDTELDIHALLKGKYYDFNLTHFKEMIYIHEGIDVGKNIIYRVAKKNNLIKRAKRKQTKRAYKPRPRMPQEGMLIQFDGSEHEWFGGFKSDLIGGIDDATGIVAGIEFFIGETSLNCMKVMKDIIDENGIPHAFYLDKAGAFGKDDRDQTSTQIGRALSAIGSNIILANSPQAKGKIERLWDTLQDRLIAELKLYDIKTIPQANKFLKEDFIPRFNENFSYPARESHKAYMELKDNLDNIFCMKEKRKISNGNTFSWNSQTYIVDENRSYKFRTVHINTHYNGDTTFDIMGKSINVRPYLPIPRESSMAA
jgi:hypothetical protein